MADLFSNKAKLKTVAVSDGAGNADTKAALLLAVASVALTGAFVFAIAEEARLALNWLMPVGSVAGLVAAAMSMRATPLNGQAWLACGTIALVAAAAVSTGILPPNTALIASGAFVTGLTFAKVLAFASKKPVQANAASQEYADESRNDDLNEGMFFDEIAEIDRHSKLLLITKGSFVVGTLLLEQVHIADRPAFLMACSNAKTAAQDLILRMHGADKTQFADMQIFLQLRKGRLMVALRKAAKSYGNTDAHDALSELAHELRTPLAAIVGFAEAMAHEQNCTEKMRKTYPNLIALAGRSLIEITGSILQSQPAYEPTRVASLNAAVQDCMTLLQPMAQQRSIALFNRVPASIAGIAVDSLALRQILTNLISNAIKFSPEGASVEISASMAANGWSLKVTDNGNGLAPEDVARLGQKNFRSDKTAGVEGHGLGLSIVRRLVDKIGGRISFESRPGKGTQVTIAFPASSLVELSSFQAQTAKGLVFQPISETVTGEKHAAA